MGSALDQGIKLLQLLNVSSHLSLPLLQLQTRFKFTHEQLLELVNELNSFDRLLIISGDRLYLKQPLDFLNAAQIYKQIKGKGRIEVIDCIDSTNSELSRRRFNCAHGDVLIAELQTQGRGQREADWSSFIGTQLTLSMFFSLQRLEQGSGLSVLVGYACVKALQRLGYEELKLKWPNDLYLNHKKLGGILVETIVQGKERIAIIGIGLNVHQNIEKPAFELSCLDSISSQNITRNQVAVALINALHGLEKLSLHDYAQLRAYDYLVDKKLRITSAQQKLEGFYQGIDAQGRLLLQSADTLHSIVSGHLELLN